MDRDVVVQLGRIAEEGSCSEMLERCGLGARLRSRLSGWFRAIEADG